MNYSETLNYIYDRMPLFQMVGSAAYKEGIDGMLAFDERLGHPHRCFKTIHVAGTNGKGSVSHTIASVLQSAGYKVGLFTSPHLKDFRERIRVNGKLVSQRFVIDFVEAHKAFFDVIYPSFFEVSVAMAFDYFREQKVDVAVVEVGLGGRLDSTNIISPDLCVVTNISMDHTNILGGTLGAIAKEKAGVIKRGTPVVIGERHPETDGVFIDKAKEMGAELTFAEDFASVDYLGVKTVRKVPYQQFSINGQAVQTPLLGIYQRKNIPTAWCAVEKLRALGYQITDGQMEKGFRGVVRQTHLLGRWQKLQESPCVICDTGHNIAGISYICQQLQQTPHKRLRMVYGMVSDKDIDHILPLLPKEAVYYFTQANSKRALPADEMLEKARRVAGLSGRAFRSVSDALAAAKAESDPDDLIYVGGSTYVVAEVI